MIIFLHDFVHSTCIPQIWGFCQDFCHFDLMIVTSQLKGIVVLNASMRFSTTHYAMAVLDVK